MEKHKKLLLLNRSGVLRKEKECSYQQSSKSLESSDAQCIQGSGTWHIPFETQKKVKWEQKSKEEFFPLILSKSKTISTVSDLNTSKGKATASYKTYPDNMLPFKKRKIFHNVCHQTTREPKIKTLASIYKSIQSINGEKN